MTRRARPRPRPSSSETGNDGVVALIGRVLTSTPNTVRALAVVIVIAVLVVGGLRLLNADLTAGPVSITGRDTTPTTSTSNAHDPGQTVADPDIGKPPGATRK